MPSPASEVGAIKEERALRALALRWQQVPMRRWSPEAFEQLGLRSPYAPGNLTIRREALAATRHLRGAVVECGVYRGQGLATLAWLMGETGDPRPLFGFDSFQGFPPGVGQDMVGGVMPSPSLPAYYAHTSEAEVRQFFRALGLDERVRLIPGFFSETLRSAPVDAVSVLILDCDLYESYRVGLEAFYPKVQAGGWIVLDEYASPKYPGARAAVDEFFAKRPEKPRLARHLLAEHPYERWYVIKADPCDAT